MRPRRDAGFTLLEIVAALTIFAFIAAVAEQTMANASYLASSGRRARELRMLAQRKLGEILAFERHFDDVLDGDFSDYKEYGDRFTDWRWQLDVRDVTVFGISNQEGVSYLLGEPTEEEKAAASAPAQGGGPAGGGAAKKGEPQILRELTLRVITRPEDGASDSVEILTFMPQVDRKTAGATK